jgi:hypothetical protein
MLCIEGLHADEIIEHKQWFLEEILRRLVYDFKETYSRYQWKKGVEPQPEE